MKLTSKKFAILALMAASSLTASAQTNLYFGPSGNGGSGTWDSGITADWATAPSGTTATWTNGDGAIFGGTPGAVTIAAGGVTADGLTFNSGGYSFTGGTLNLAAPTGSTAISIVTTGTTTMGSAINETSGDFFTPGPTFSGGGTIIFTASPTFYGQILVNGGTTLQFGNNSATAVASRTNYFALSGGSTLIYNDNVQEGEGNTVAGAGNVVIEGYGAGYLNVNGYSTNTGTTTINLAAGSSSQVYDDTLFVNSGSGFSANGVLNVLQGVIDFRTSTTVGGLSGTGGYVATDYPAGNANTLTSLTAAGQTYTYSGVIGASQLAGTLGFTNNNLVFAVAGTGTQVLSGANTYTNGTIIEGGTLKLTGSLASTGALTSNGVNGVFDLDGSATTGAKAQSMGALSFVGGEGTVEEVLGTATSDTLTFSSESRSVGAAANFTNSGGVNGVTEATVITGHAAGFMDQGTFYGLGAAGATYADYDSGGFVRGFNYLLDSGGALVLPGATLGATTSASHVETTGAITAQTTGTVNTVQLAGANGTNTIAIGSGQTLTTSGVLLTGTGSGDGAGAITGGTLSGGANELVLAASQTGDVLTVSSNIDATSTGGVTEAGSGKVILTGSNNYSGITSAAGGILQIGNGTSGSLASGYSGAFHTGGTIVFDLPAASTTFSGVISGVGGITQMTNTVVLTGNNTYTGSTVVGAGATLQFGNGTGASAAGVTGAMTVGAGGTIVFDDNNAESVGPISGAGNVTFEGQSTGYYGVGAANGAGPGTFSTQNGLINDLTITGTTTISMVQNTGATGYDGVVFAATNGLSANSVVNFVSGDIDIRGSNTVAGLTGGAATNGFFTDGARGTTLPVLTDNVASGKSYTFAGAIGLPTGNTYAITTNIPIAFNMTGAGTQILTGPLSYAGGTTVNSGTLVSAGANTTTGATTVNGGGTFLADAGGNAGTGSVTNSSITAIGTGNSALATVGGNGTISKAVTVGNYGVLSVGDANDSFGTTNKLALTTSGGVVMNSGSTLSFVLNGATAGTQYSQLYMGASGNSTLTLNGTVNLQLTLNFAPTVNEQFLLTDNSFNVLGTTGYFSELNGTADALTEGSTFTLNGDTFGITYLGGPEAGDVELTVDAIGSGSTSYYFTGSNSGSFTDAGNFYTLASGGSQQSTALSSTSNVYLDATSPVPQNKPPTLNTSATINSLTFLTGGETLAGSGTLTIVATGTAGITDSVGNSATTETIAPSVVLGSSQSWVATANSTLNVTGSISGAQSLALTGAGTYKLGGANTFQGLTVGTGSDTPTVLLTNGSNGSATGATTLTVNSGATLGGSGTSLGTTFAISGSGTTTATRANVLVGLNSTTDTSVATTLTLKASGASTIQDANLTFNLNTAVAGGLGTDPANSGTELVVGSTAITFGSGSKSTILTLNLQGGSIIVANTPYVLVAGLTSGGTDQYSGLSLGTSTGSLATGLLTPILNSGNGDTGDLNLVLTGTAASFYGSNSYLFLYQNSTTGADDIEVEVVPEPSTWALMLSGVVVLVYWQRRRGKQS